MSSFTENVCIQPLPKRNMRVTTKSFVYCVGSLEGKEIVEVPVGYEFDGASVPMLFGRFIQRVEPRTISAACLHDYLYTKGRRYSLIKTDWIFFESLRVSGVGLFKAVIMYVGVLLGGRLYWCNII